MPPPIFRLHTDGNFGYPPGHFPRTLTAFFQTLSTLSCTMTSSLASTLDSPRGQLHEFECHPRHFSCTMTQIWLLPCTFFAQIVAFFGCQPQHIACKMTPYFGCQPRNFSRTLTQFIGCQSLHFACTLKPFFVCYHAHFSRTLTQIFGCDPRGFACTLTSFFG
jgi:hypothetical protein